MYKFVSIIPVRELEVGHIIDLSGFFAQIVAIEMIDDENLAKILLEIANNPTLPSGSQIFLGIEKHLYLKTYIEI